MKKNFPLQFIFLLSIAFLLTLGHAFGEDNPPVMVFKNANSRQTYFTLHRITEAQALSQGKGCKVGVLDHSFGMAKHPDLYARGKNFVSDDDEFLTTREWHGYWMANVLHEIAPQAEIYALNTFSFKDENYRATAISNAVDWAIQQKIQVLTYSQASIEGENKKIFNAALDRAHKAGIITTFIHTGHHGNIMPSGLWPGMDDGREPDINILQYDYSIIPVDEYLKIEKGEKSWWQPFLSLSSTSPVLGGVVALMKSINPNLTAEQCKKILRDTSRPLEFEGRIAPRALDALAALLNAKNYNKTAPAKETASFGRNAETFDIDNATLTDVIKKFGEPLEYVWGQEKFKKENLPGRFVAVYQNGFSICMVSGKVLELRYEGPAAFAFGGKLKFGSTLDEVFAVVGAPRETKTSGPITWADGVLYKDMDGQKGRCYYELKDKRVRMFFNDYKVVAIFLTRSNRIQERAEQINTLKKYDDIRGKNASTRQFIATGNRCNASIRPKDDLAEIASDWRVATGDNGGRKKSGPSSKGVT